MITIKKNLLDSMLKLEKQNKKRKHKLWKEYSTEVEAIWRKHNMAELIALIRIKKMMLFLEYYGKDKSFLRWFGKLTPEQTCTLMDHYVPPYLASKEVWKKPSQLSKVLRYSE